MAVVVSPALAAAWQQALAAEYAAVFGYGLLGPHLSAAAQLTLARACQAQHSTSAAATAAALLAAAQPAPPPQADYPSQYPVTDDLSAQRLATRLEEAGAAAWRYLISIAATGPTPDPTLAPLRATAVGALSASAVRAMQWRRIVNATAPTVPFPGI